jgi:hypothetical protein
VAGIAGFRGHPLRWLFLLMALALVESKGFSAKALPNYSDYAVTNIFRGKPVEVDLASHSKARRYRTMLSFQAAQGANFAGHYRVATWGCGTECNEFAIVDCKTGKVYFIDEMPYVTWNRYPGKDPGLHFRLESRLLVLEGSPVDGPEKGKFFYLWEKNKLRQIRAELVK